MMVLLIINGLAEPRWVGAAMKGVVHVGDKLIAVGCQTKPPDLAQHAQTSSSSVIQFIG